MSDDKLAGALADLDNFLTEDKEIESVFSLYGSRQMNEQMHEQFKAELAEKLEAQGQQLMQAIDAVRQLAEKRPRRIKAPSGKFYEIED